jgi:hypothetical protein
MAPTTYRNTKRYGPGVKISRLWRLITPLSSGSSGNWDRSHHRNASHELRGHIAMLSVKIGEGSFRPLRVSHDPSAASRRWEPLGGARETTRHGRELRTSDRYPMWQGAA